MAAARRLCLCLTAAMVALTAATGCLGEGGPVTPSATTSSGASPDPTPSTVVTASPTAIPTAPATAAYPGSARLYAEAVLLAWRTRDWVRLGTLATPAVQGQLQTTTGLEPNWSAVDCQDAAGSTYCRFVNADGDVATVRLDNQLVGRARAATEVKLDPTTYSNNAIEYVKAFIEAWRTANTRRMAILATPAEVTYLSRVTPPATYSTCATLSGGTASVRVYDGSRLNHTVTVRISALGGEHAITGHASTPAACP